MSPRWTESFAVCARVATLEIAGVAVREIVRRGSGLAVPVKRERFDDPGDEGARDHH